MPTISKYAYFTYLAAAAFYGSWRNGTHLCNVPDPSTPVGRSG